MPSSSWFQKPTYSLSQVLQVLAKLPAISFPSLDYRGSGTTRVLKKAGQIQSTQPRPRSKDDRSHTPFSAATSQGHIRTSRSATFPRVNNIRARARSETTPPRRLCPPNGDSLVSHELHYPVIRCKRWGPSVTIQLLVQPLSEAAR